MKSLPDVTQYLKINEDKLDAFTGLMMDYYEEEKSENIEKGLD